MPTIRIVKLSKRFQRSPVLTDLNLEIQAQERWALIGRSGAGKTTLLRLLCGLEQATGGEIWIGDQKLNDLPPTNRSISLVTQDYPLYPHLTVQQNLNSAVAVGKLSPAETAFRIDEALEWFRIAELRQRLPDELSGGQAQRVALARALVRRPDILLLDEPLSQVDTIFRQEIRELILAAVARYQTTLIMVTHDAYDALWMTTHLAVIDQAHLVQQGPTAWVYQKPASTIAAELLSPHGINWFDLHQPDVRELLGSQSIPAGAERLGIRPEHIRLQPVETNLGATALRLDVEICKVQSCGFAQMADALAGSQTLKIIDWNNSLHPGKTILAVPREQCIWL